MSDRIRSIVVTVAFSAFILLFSVWGIVEKDKDISVSERKPLTQMPDLSGETVLSGSFMTDFESYSVDQFPMRDSFRELKAITSFYALRQKDSNGIYLKNGQASRLEYPIAPDSIAYAVDRMNNIYNMYLAGKDIKSYLCIVPDKNCYMAAQNGYPAIDYEEFKALVTGGVEFAENIDIYDLLETDDYFATDIHWREERIIDVAERLTAKMGAPFNGNFEEVELDVPFYGVYCGQSALPLKADAIKYVTGPSIESATAFDFETNSDIPVYSMELANGRDPYEMYLCGSKSLITIENPDALSDKELIIFRDSFGSSLAPLLTEGYKKITLVDIRYLQSAFVGSFVDFSDQDVLFLYSIPVLNNSVTMK